MKFKNFEIFYYHKLCLDNILKIYKTIHPTLTRANSLQITEKMRQMGIKVKVTNTLQNEKIMLKCMYLENLIDLYNSLRSFL